MADFFKFSSHLVTTLLDIQTKFLNPYFKMHFKHAKSATGVFLVTSTPKRGQNDRLGPGYTLEPVKNRQNVGGWMVEVCFY